jgi:hypothetical protein
VTEHAFVRDGSAEILLVGTVITGTHSAN